MSEDGWVYCISNPSNTALLKIGMTVRTPQERLAEANRPNTWIARPFKLEFAKKVKWPLQKEQTLHKLMEQYNERENPDREFFRISVERARLYFDLMDGEYLEQAVEEDPVEIPNNKPKRTRRTKKSETAPVIEQVIPSAPTAPIPELPLPAPSAPNIPSVSTPPPVPKSADYKATKEKLIDKLKKKHQEITKKSNNKSVIKEPVQEVPIDIRNLQILLKELPSITIKNLPKYNSKNIIHTALDVKSLEIKTSNRYYHYDDLIKISVSEIQEMIKELSKKEYTMIISSPTSQDRCITVDNYLEINDELRNKKDSTFVLIKCF